MIIKYGDAPDKQIHSNEADLVNQIYRLLLAKEMDNPNLNYMFSTLLFRLSGLNAILLYPPELITVLSLLESAKTEKDFKLYRKAILDSCHIVNSLITKAGELPC